MPAVAPHDVNDPLVEGVPVRRLLAWLLDAGLIGALMLCSCALAAGLDVADRGPGYVLPTLLLLSGFPALLPFAYPLPWLTARHATPGQMLLDEKR